MGHKRPKAQGLDLAIPHKLFAACTERHLENAPGLPWFLQRHQIVQELSVPQLYGKQGTVRQVWGTCAMHGRNQRWKQRTQSCSSSGCFTLQWNTQGLTCKGGWKSSLSGCKQRLQELPFPRNAVCHPCVTQDRLGFPRATGCFCSFLSHLGHKKLMSWSGCPEQRLD